MHAQYGMRSINVVDALIFIKCSKSIMFFFEGGAVCCRVPLINWTEFFFTLSIELTTLDSPWKSRYQSKRPLNFLHKILCCFCCCYCIDWLLLILVNKTKWNVTSTGISIRNSHGIKSHCFVVEWNNNNINDKRTFNMRNPILLVIPRDLHISQMVFQMA